MIKRYIIIGASAAGLNAAHTIRKFDSAGEIIIVTQELEFPYNKCRLASHLAAYRNSDISLFDTKYLEQKNIILKQGMSVTTINQEDQSVTMSDNSKLWYDKVLISTGTRPLIPQIAGLDSMHDGFFTFHTYADICAIDNYIKKNSVRRATIIGGGVNALECADALYRRGVHVTVLEKRSHILPDIISHEAARSYLERYFPTTMKIMCDTIIHGIVSKNGLPVNIVFNDKSIDCDMIICATGVAPNIKIALDAKLDVCDGLLMVNQYMQTNDMNIFGAGDIIRTYDKVRGIWCGNNRWADAVQQGMCAGSAMVGNLKSYSGTVGITNSSFFDISLNFGGKLNTEDTIEKMSPKQYLKIFLDGNFVKGFLMVGTNDLLGILTRAMMNSEPINRALLRD